MNNLLRLYHTVKYLKFVQIKYQIWYRIKRLFVEWDRVGDLSKGNMLTLNPLLNNRTSFLPTNTFNFLNIEKNFEDSIEWNYSGLGKLWTYNLNYFDFLHQEKITVKIMSGLIMDFINKYDAIKIGKEPYPTSLRIINWIKFISVHNITDKSIDLCLAKDLNRLRANIEYHLLGNHLLENGFALLFGAYYFRDINLFNKASEILTKELDEQILDDGAHFERSPMYHQLMLLRVLDSYNLIKNNAWLGNDQLLILKDKASLMLGWLTQITFRNGDIPLLNDAAFNINPTTDALNMYAVSLDVVIREVSLSDCGYRKFGFDQYELVIDVGGVKPDYQPGHAHAGTFGFILYIDKIPFFVDSGTSTYEPGNIRSHERSTQAHNTVTINNANSSDVWSAFRVSKRVEVIKLEEHENQISASHNGFRCFDTTHKRTWTCKENVLSIEDEVKGQETSGTAHFLLHPDIEVVKRADSVIHTNMGMIRFIGSKNISLVSSFYSPEFNKRINSQQLAVEFEHSLVTEIQFNS